MLPILLTFKGGWWSYDSRSTEEIEECYKAKNSSTFDILICGDLYSIDFQKMIQYMKNNHTKKRNIKRERIGFHNKGVAGILKPKKH